MLKLYLICYYFSEDYYYRYTYIHIYETLFIFHHINDTIKLYSLYKEGSETTS